MRLSELKEGDAVIRYGYDGKGRLTEKTFPNGMKSSYYYNNWGKLERLVHKDKEGILDQYSYGYDLAGNKVEVMKERRGLPEENGNYRYGYDPLGRLSEVSRNGELLRQYQYDAWRGRILQKSERLKEKIGYQE